MSIVYEITEKDYINFNWFHHKNSKSMKKTMYLIRFVSPVLFLFLSGFMWFTKKGLNPGSILLLIIAVFWIVYFPIFIKKSIKKQTKKMISEGKNKGLLGKKKLEITKQHIIESNEYTETKHSWSSIEKIVDISEYIFIYASAVSAYIIPNTVFSSAEEKNKFLNTLNEYSKLG